MQETKVKILPLPDSNIAHKLYKVHCHIWLLHQVVKHFERSTLLKSVYDNFRTWFVFVINKQNACKTLFLLVSLSIWTSVSRWLLNATKLYLQCTQFVNRDNIGNIYFPNRTAIVTLSDKMLFYFRYLWYLYSIFT